MGNGIRTGTGHTDTDIDRGRGHIRPRALVRRSSTSGADNETGETNGMHHHGTLLTSHGGGRRQATTGIESKTITGRDRAAHDNHRRDLLSGDDMTRTDRTTTTTTTTTGHTTIIRDHTIDATAIAKRGSLSTNKTINELRRSERGVWLRCKTMHPVSKRIVGRGSHGSRKRSGGGSRKMTSDGPTRDGLLDRYGKRSIALSGLDSGWAGGSWNGLTTRLPSLSMRLDKLPQW